MGDLVTYLLHLGIVRVLSVPVAMSLIIYVLYRMAAPPEWNNDDGERHA
jgi:hypothetical protein